MDDCALISFDSPVANRVVKNMATPVCMQSPLIPCPVLPHENNPFDKVAAAAEVAGNDPFEQVLRPSAAPDTPTSRKTPSPASTPGKDTQCGTSMVSELDISQLVTGRQLISSTPHASENLRTRSRMVQPGTPTSGRYKKQGHTFNELIGQMSVENLRMVVRKKMENLEILNRRLNLPPYNTNMKRSLSTSSLCPGTVQQQLFNQSRCESSLGYESQLQNSSLLPDGDSNNSLLQSLMEPPLATIFREDAFKVAAAFDRVTAQLVKDSARNAGAPAWKPLSAEEIRKIPPYKPPPGAFATPDPKLTDVLPDDLRLEVPPWEDDGYLFSSDDEDGLPKLKIFRLATPKNAQNSASSSDRTSLVNRYKKTRSSLKLEADRAADVGRGAGSQEAIQPNPAADATATICTDEQATIVIPTNPAEESTAPADAEQLVEQAPAVDGQIPTVADEVPAVDQQVPTIDNRTIPLVPKRGPLKAVVPLPKMVKSSVPARFAATKDKAQCRQPTPPSPTKLSTPSSGNSRIVPRRDVNRQGSYQRSRSASSPSFTSDSSQKKMASPALPQKMTPVSRKGVLQALANAQLGPKSKIKSGISSIKRPLSSAGKENLSK